MFKNHQIIQIKALSMALFRPVLIPTQAQRSVLDGKVLDLNGAPAPYVNVFINALKDE